MKYIIIVIIALVTLTLFIERNNTEHFQSNTTTASLSDLMTNINLNNTLVNSNDPISFNDENLNLNSISDDLLGKFKNQLDLDVSDANTNSLDTINNGGEYKKKYEKLENDIAKLKLITEEISRRRLQRRNQFHLKTVKKKLERLKKYDENKKLDIYSSCPTEPFPFNTMSIENTKYSLDLSRHPIKWHGLETPELQNKLPYNFAVF
jgi:hypothetical protein